VRRRPYACLESRGFDLHSHCLYSFRVFQLDWYRLADMLMSTRRE
jgi:hypothetical protein